MSTSRSATFPTGSITAQGKNEPACRGGGRHSPRAQGNRFLDRYEKSFDFQQLKAFRAIQRCRTAALGGHIDACPGCGYQAALSYNSCRNRHCPKCQAQARARWLGARERELLATSYFQVVFTVPHELNVLALDNQREFYDLLFTASAQTLLEAAANPKHLGAEIGMVGIFAHLGAESTASSAHSLRHPSRGDSDSTISVGFIQSTLSSCR